MKRRELITGIGTAAAAGILSAPAIAQQQPELNWRIVSVAPKTQALFYNACVTFSKMVADLTDGKFKIQVFGPGEIVPALAIFDAVQNQTIEMGYTASYFSIGREPTFALGSSLPFGPNARLQHAWFRAGGLDLLNEFYKKQDTIMFPGGNTGAQMFGWFRKELKSKESLQGLKMRVGGLGGTILSRLGVVPQQLPTGDTYAALERGTIDAVEVTGPFDDERFGFQKVAPFYYYPSFSEGNVELGFFISLSKWNGLPKQYQSAIRAACSFAADEALAGYDGEQTEPLRRLLANGTQLRQVPSDITDAARVEALALYDELSAKSEDFKKIYTHYRDFTANAYQWWQVAEYGYDSMMLKSLRR
ncbi:TRAP transporter substrate-binding protein [Bradyrhizobium sp. Ash2021]|uniref:TRAP transporter substrate-binding protein n=1 Tax=Bradyrhizobium sp. Ash2021 TaxID=2954771 RepID=UPI0028161A54|nr:TRAP transporter substrate-binding protein [Bradyrhizobium sp. Ash2021]WMT73474.1 TRAP transporter substrate-binding protein [Bradyrhizobium sp. Ash2021]